MGIGKKDLETKVFILDSKDAGNAADAFEGYAEIHGRKIEVKHSHANYMARVPRDYDIYVLHLSNFNFEDLEVLKEEQPWSFIVGITGGDMNPSNAPRVFKVLDRCHFLLSYSRIGEILEESKKKYKAGQVE